MKRKEEYNEAKKLLNEMVSVNTKQSYSRSKEKIVMDLIKLENKDILFIETMLLSSRFYNSKAEYIKNMRAVDFLMEDICAFELVSYMELVEKMKRI